ncbi:MAG: hypothetical protein PHV11_08280 [Candidatus Bipolaricaulis sp.]|nr:hypothetical protein [Candidatus Bipolaricaulis sp.]
MTIAYIMNSIMDFKNGCYYYRAALPIKLLRKAGHIVKEITINYEDYESLLKDVDTIVFQRMYGKPVTDIIKTAKKLDIKIVYDIDDDIWNVPVHNPASVGNINATLQINELLKAADLVTTTTNKLKKILDKQNKNVVVVPNAIDPEIYTLDRNKNNYPVVIYSGSASHWGDMLEILPILYKLKKECPFVFVLQGFTQEPVEAAMYCYQKLVSFNVFESGSEYQRVALKCWEYLKDMGVIHLPFYPVEMYPYIMKRINADIGLCPLEDNEFNKSKSCIKFYEYASLGIATLAPDLLPYSEEVDEKYNGLLDFKEKLRRLLVDTKHRKETVEEQRKWVMKNRDINKVIKLWEKVLN